MKSPFNCFNRGLSLKLRLPKRKAKDSKHIVSSPPSTTSSKKENDSVPRLPPLKELPPLIERPQCSIHTPTSTASFEPLSETEISSLFRPSVRDTVDYITTSTTLSRPPLSDVAVEESTDITAPFDIVPPRVDKVSAERSTCETGNGNVMTNGGNGVLKNIASISLARTPVSSSPGIGRPSANDASAAGNSGAMRSSPREPRRSTSASASTSRADVGSSRNGTPTVKARRAPSPYPKKTGGDGASVHRSLRSGTSFSQPSTGSLAPPASWGEGAEGDLVTHLGPRERTRQEVLWEIVASEERYLSELLKMKETFIEPLLHPYATSPIASPMFELDEMSCIDTPWESLENLPIASRFLSPSGFRVETPTALDHVSRREDKDNSNMDGESLNSDFEDDPHESRREGQGNLNDLASKHNHLSSPLAASRTGKTTSVPYPSRSHQSLPPPPRPKLNAASTPSLGRESFVGPISTDKDKERDRDLKSTFTDPSARTMLRKSRKSLTADNDDIAPHQIPDDLRRCLKIIEDIILPGHIKLSESLRKRYDEQYPLVRSLADVLIDNLHFLRGYADYVLHLERALEQANGAITNRNLTKRPKNKDQDEWLKVSAFLRKLELNAQDRGETGLAISLSKPFRRLLNYSMLFQALLFHTDPWMLDYEGVLKLVAQVEDIIRGIEDAKNQKEEHDKTRDILARIKGLDKQLAVPKPSRFLMEEVMLNAREDIPRIGWGGIGSRKDVWLVVFNDVVLRCQRTGTTFLPLGADQSSKANSLSELQGNYKFAATSRQNSSARPRNLYKFIKIEDWAIGNSREGVVSTEDVVRSRAQIYSAVRPQFTPIPEGGEDRLTHSDDLDHNREMSFSHSSTDNVSLQKSMGESQLGSAGPDLRQTESPLLSLYPGSSLANAKYASRLVSANSLFSGNRPPSRPTVTTPTVRSVMSDEGYSVRALTSLGDYSWGQNEPTAPFLYSGESFANAKFGGRVVPLNPLLSRDRSSIREVGKGDSARTAPRASLSDS